MNTITMPVPNATEVLGGVAANFPNDFKLPPVVVARVAIIDYRK